MKLCRGLGCMGLAWVAAASAATWQGTVFNDANGNGRRDAGEAGIADVSVSNGAAVTRTDAAGRYTIEGEGDGFLFVVKPRNWSVPLDAQNLPRFYRRIGDPADPGRVVDPALPTDQSQISNLKSPAGSNPGRPSGSALPREPGRPSGSALPNNQPPITNNGGTPAPPIDFPLTPADEADRFRVLVFADTQVGSEKEIGYFQRTIVDGIVGNAQRSTLNAQRSSEGLSNPGQVVSEVGLTRRVGRDDDPSDPGRPSGSALPTDQFQISNLKSPAGSNPGRLIEPALPRDPGRPSGSALPSEPGRLIEAALPNNQQPITNNPESYAFGVTLGDVVNDKPELYDALNAAIARIGVPWHPLIGNHDLDLGALQDRGSAATFEAKYGPSTHAFQYGPVLFVALNNIRYQGGLRYLGGLTDNQYTFIQQLLAGTPRETLVVVMMHIPWFYNDPANNETFRLADRARLFRLLEGRPNLLLLSGHSHYQRHVFYGAAEGWTGAQPLHEYNVAAVSGGFWGGPPDANGIPIATQWDGTPHGHAILTFDGTKAPLMDYSAARLAPDDQIGLWGPAVVALKQSYVSFYANVYNGHEGWKIEGRVDDRVFNPMRKVVDWDPAYAAQYLAQDAGPNPAPSPRLPDPLVNYHLWRAYLPADLAAGPHTIEVRATDPAGKVYSAKRTVQIR